jgi:hypothetical protein
MNEAMTPLPDAKLLAQYGCGPIRFTGDADALYERHLLFDNVVAPAATGGSRDLGSRAWARLRPSPRYGCRRRPG